MRHRTALRAPIATAVLLLQALSWPCAAEPSAAQAAFARFKALEGRWRGASTRGWEEETTVRVIAGGSVVVLRSFDAHPGESMLTTVFLDGERLMLVHYCIAGNQPRMVDGSISPEGRHVAFDFLDGTNLPTRDRGHMDRAVFDFGSDEDFTSRWTWYQDGSEKWLEEVRYRRIDEARSGAD